jgi:archaellum component FlaC
MTNAAPEQPSRLDRIEHILDRVAEQQAKNTEAIAANFEQIAQNAEAISELKITVAETSAKVDQLTNAVNAMMPVIASHSQRFELQQATLQTMMAQLIQHDVKLKQLESA